jgi:hypothetical protein
MKNKNNSSFDPTDIEQIWALKAFVASPTFTFGPPARENQEALMACLQELISRIKNQPDRAIGRDTRPTGR